jgi:hypothetical protein
MTTLKAGASRVQYLVAAFGFALCAMLLQAAPSQAAADTLTGIDAKTDIADPAIDSAQPFLLAGVGVMALLVAVSLGIKLWGKVSGARK